MNKKLFIFSLIFFLISTGILFFTSFALAGDIRGTCTCAACFAVGGEAPPAAPAPTPLTGANRAVITLRCTEHCNTDDCGAVGTISGESCVVAVGETVNASGVCAAAAPAGGASEKKGTEKKDGKTQSIKAITLPNPLGTTDVRVVIGNIIRAVLGVIGSIALVLFMYGGFLWMTAAGDPTKAKKGQQTIIQATIGLVIIFISYTLVNFVLSSLTSIGETTTEEELEE